MLKMVVSSFYNTLIDGEDAIPASTMLEIERIRKKGIIFSICTNRTYKEILDYNKDFPFVDYIISLNGTYVYDVEKGKCIFKKKITQTILNKIKSFIPDVQCIYYGESEIYSSSEEIIGKDIYKIEIEVEDNGEKIKDKLKNLPLNFSILNYNNKKYLEITTNQTSMFSGVDKISLKRNLTLSDIVVIGGNESDISLIQNIQRNFVVKNAPTTLKKHSTRRTNSNLLKGVEYVISKIK